MIDWDTAISTGVRFAKQGPQVSLTDARARRPHSGAQRVAARAAQKAEGVRPYRQDRPHPHSGRDAADEPLTEKLAERGNSMPGGAVIGSVGARVTGVQAGLLLAYLSSRVLGQYELFLPPGEGEVR